MFDEAPLATHALMQDPAFETALRRCGQDPLRLPGGLMVLQRRFAGMRVCMLPRAVPPVDLAAQLREMGLHRNPLILSPETLAPLPRCLPVQGARASAIWDVSRRAADCRAGLHPKWRNQLKRAEARALQFSHHRLPPDPQGDVLKKAAEQAKARGYSLWPAPLTAAFAAVAPNQTHLFKVKSKGVEIAHMLFLSHGTRASYHIGHTTEAGKAASAHNLLLWRAARHLARAGVTQLDLGLVDGQTPGLDRFKLRTGAQPVPTGGTHLYWAGFAGR